jgi:hypothetical protein
MKANPKISVVMGYCKGASYMRQHWCLPMEVPFHLLEFICVDILAGARRKGDFNCDSCEPARLCVRRHFIRQNRLSAGLRARRPLSLVSGVRSS